MSETKVRRRDLTEEFAINLLREFVRREGSLRKLANVIGISPAYLSDVLRGNRSLGPTLLNYLKLEKIVTYKVSYRVRRRR